MEARGLSHDLHRCARIAYSSAHTLLCQSASFEITCSWASPDGSRHDARNTSSDDPAWHCVKGRGARGMYTWWAARGASAMRAPD
jgi:hypothetical protein